MIPSNRDKVLVYLERNPHRSFTPKQIARWSHLTEHLVIKQLEALAAEGIIHEEPPRKPQEPRRRAARASGTDSRASGA